MPNIPNIKIQSKPKYTKTKNCKKILAFCM